MIDARTRFKEGFVMVMRPFQFENLRNPIQKFTILWAYSEKPKIRKELTESAKEETDLIGNASFGPRFMTTKEKEEYVEKEVERVFRNPKNWEETYIGEVVQTYIDGQLVRLYPGEYNIIDKAKLQEILEEEGYHAVCSRGLYELKEFRDKQHYLRSRGITKGIANKWASASYKELVYYKPYYELLTLFCRDNEIYMDAFYEEVEGIKIADQKAPSYEISFHSNMLNEL